MKKISVTFKDNERENTIYDFISEHTSPAAFLKDLAWEEYKRKNTLEKSQSNEQKAKNIPSYDFLD